MYVCVRACVYVFKFINGAYKRHLLFSHLKKKNQMESQFDLHK